MADEGEEGGQKYIFVTENKETKTMSRGFTGRATASYPNGELYDGYFLDGIREGRGKYNYTNGDKYDGEWKQNMKHGIGKMVYDAVQTRNYPIVMGGVLVTTVLFAMATLIADLITATLDPRVRQSL